MGKKIEHLKIVLTHKYHVFNTCCKAGIPIRGFLHDLSKFSYIEFSESSKYFTGTSSPINGAKADKGYSEAWFHHRGRNKHHWEYWVDSLSKGGIPILMPYEYAVEMMCDFIGAGKAYEKSSWNFQRPYKWFQEQVDQRRKIHPVVVSFIDRVLLEMAYDLSYDALHKKNTKRIYEEEIEKWKAN